MNEKIRELAEQATRRYDRLGFEIPFAQPDLEEFAELIIEETIKSIEATAAESIDMERTLEENVSLTVDDIKRQFGIE